ncbi:alpha-galactosidase [Algoriphagus aquimarinus]|uniref:Melibiase n=1 Tax=Algoriphagus aquimarinus TaxID=237018 RepID=A0A1I1BPL2_9BACT|nr:alpha-galactosidase [Algoriphagus aquimarinus]SFB52325.1 Melibiase [Algoriphagus aquimarinus]
MKFKNLVIIGLLAILFASFKQGNSIVLENDYLSRTISVADGTLSTIAIVNKINGKTITPSDHNEFKLRISKGTSEVNGDITLTAKDFEVVNFNISKENNSQTLVVELQNKKHKLKVDVHYELADNESYARKYLKITSEKNITLERIDVDAISANGAYQPYTLKEITTQGPANWKPGLGQPLYERESATFWGIEFPAATNEVVNQELNCGYLWGNELNANQTYTSYKSVLGVADDYEFIDEAFYKYIDNIRIRPLRLQVQYNSWFDFHSNVDKESFKKSSLKIHNELVSKRDVKPLNAYVIDDGWQDSRRKDADWSDKVWKINEKFSPDFQETFKTIDSLDSKLGLWLSPGCFFGARPMVEKLGEKGFERLELSMSMTGEKYMQKLEDRVLELTGQGVNYFKFDGIFGHLNIRDFELQGRGTPKMTQLGVENLSPNDSTLNDPIYDELKTYYLVNGTERIIEIFNKMDEIDPDVFIAITNGAYLSSWWLQYVDVVWMINAGDAAGGSSRTDELTYRDGVYYEIWETENTKFPMNAIFNHEPKKDKTGEDEHTFRDYLFMNLSRGTGFIELYLKTDNLVDKDWDVIAEGLKWSEKVFPTFHNVRMHGGNPRNSEVYGYSAWDDDQGYISIHNPSDKSITYKLVLNRELGISNSKDKYVLSSPIENNTAGLKNSYSPGDTLTVDLKPKEIRVLNFN